MHSERKLDGKNFANGSRSSLGCHLFLLITSDIGKKRTDSRKSGRCLTRFAPK
jgi:hypothetical protein